MVKLPTLVDMLKAGMHFGHRCAKWHPKMKQFIFGQRNGVHIIDLQQTVQQLESILTEITDMVSKGGILLFVGTKQQAKGFIKEQAERCGMPYIQERWIGGLLTNFKVVSRLTRKLRDLKKQQVDGELDKYTKKEQLAFQKEIDRLQGLVGGIENMERIPQALFVADIKHEKTAMAEASKKGITTIAICDTNVNPDKVDYIIPANDDAVQSIEMIASLVADAVLEGKELYEKNKAAEVKKSDKNKGSKQKVEKKDEEK